MTIDRRFQVEVKTDEIGGYVAIMFAAEDPQREAILTAISNILNNAGRAEEADNTKHSVNW